MSEPLPLVYACAGCSNAGKLTYDLARALEERGTAEMSCLAGVAARKPNFLKQLRGRGKTILFSTHIMREVEKLCDRVAIMARGKIVACGTLEDLRHMYKQDDLEELFFALVS